MDENELVLKKSGIILAKDESLEIGIEAELWASSSNIISRILGGIARFLAFLTGVRRNGFLLLTNKRLIEVSQLKLCWVFNASKNVKTIMPSSIKEVGYYSEGTFLGCFCQAYHLYYEAYTQKTSVLLKNANEEDAEYLSNSIYNTILEQQKQKTNS